MQPNNVVRALLIALFVILSITPGSAETRPAHEPAHSGAPVEAGVEEKVDYLILLANSSLEPAVSSLVTWKQEIGLKVWVDDVPSIAATSPGADWAERIWNYLHDRYQDWGLRYVLLVGDIDTIPMRLLYPDGVKGDGLGYGSDFYYANLDVEDWDLDHDGRWGEFKNDQLDLQAEVIVGRLPFNDYAKIETFANNVVDFESDTGAWKRSAFLAHGLMDISDANVRTDNAVLAEKLVNDYFEPYGWTTTRHYEYRGLSPSIYAGDGPLSQTLYNNVLGIDTQSVVNVTMHGNPYNMSSAIWVVDSNANGTANFEKPDKEGGYTEISFANDIPLNPTNGLVFLCGCSTAALYGDDPEVVTTTLGSRYWVKLVRNHTMVKNYLQYGAPVVIGATAGADYGHLWDDVDDDKMQGLNYLFYQNLIGGDKRAGEAFYEALQTTSKLYGSQRGVRDFNYFGDPALMLKGVEDHPGGWDSQITESSYKKFAADYDDNGDMYVGVLVDNPSGDASSITIYRSTDHGENWDAWTVIDDLGDLANDLAILVGRYSGEITEDVLHVIYGAPNGEITQVKIELADPDNRTSATIAALGSQATNLSLARDPGALPDDYHLYLAWEYKGSSTEHSALYISLDNGHSWNSNLDLPLVQTPVVEAGALGHIYLALRLNGDQKGIGVLHSPDYGATWPEYEMLATDDGALVHSAPDVAVSTDAAIPTVWVAYNYQFQDPVHGLTHDIRFAYSEDYAASWTLNIPLSSDLGVDEWMPDLAGYRPAPNRWVNLVYNLDNPGAYGHTRQVIWRWASGGLPPNWSARRIVNDYESATGFAEKPLVIYSPGASAPGSGVVYGGENRQNLYFSAPWLVDTFSKPQVERPHTEAVYFSTSLEPAETTAVAAIPPGEARIWYRLADLPQATSVGGLAVGLDGALYAAASSWQNDANRGHVLRSEDWGESWEELGGLPDAWSLAGLIRTDSGALLAGGMSLDLSNPELPQAGSRIYRSLDNSQNWNVVHEGSSAAVYRLYQDGAGRLYAGLGPSGTLLQSLDGGASWSPLTGFGDDATVRAVFRPDSGPLMAGVEAAGDGFIYVETPGAASQSTAGPVAGWTAAAGLEGVSVIYDLAQFNGRLYAATQTLTGARIYRANMDGLNWMAMNEPGIPARAFTDLLAVGDEFLFAASAQFSGPSAAQVYRLGPGEEHWLPYRGPLDLANTISDLLVHEGELYAASGHTYGNIYRVSLFGWNRVFLPLILR